MAEWFRYFHLPRPTPKTDKINAELLGAQGRPVDLGGYYQPDPAKAARAMRPSPALNAIVESLS